MSSKRGSSTKCGVVGVVAETLPSAQPVESGRAALQDCDARPVERGRGGGDATARSELETSLPSSRALRAASISRKTPSLVHRACRRKCTHCATHGERACFDTPLSLSLEYPRMSLSYLSTVSIRFVGTIEQ